MRVTSNVELFHETARGVSELTLAPGEYRLRMADGTDVLTVQRDTVVVRNDDGRWEVAGLSLFDPRD